MIFPGLDADWTRIGRGFWIAHRLYTNCTRIGLGLDADSKKGNYLLTKEGPVQFVPNWFVRSAARYCSGLLSFPEDCLRLLSTAEYFSHLLSTESYLALLYQIRAELKTDV